MEPTKNFFPLKDNESVVNFFKEELKKDQPNLAQLSLIVGFFEEANTCKTGTSDSSCCPTLDEETYDALYCKFMALLQRDFSFNAENKPATREFVKSVADLVWGCLAKSYFKDRLHIQNLYSFLTGNRLDCFGVALTVVAVCQALGYHDVHLCLSEDHAWVSFGINGTDTAEVTWHGKGNEDKRGRPVEFDEESSKSWLYLNGNAVCCTRHMEVASIVSSINTSINHNTDSTELAKLQKELLWILYDMGHLKKYPMALCNLATLEEMSPTLGRPTSEQIFKESIEVAKIFYNNQHIYPYTYLGGYYNRKKLYGQAIKCWVKAAYVAGKYNYSKEDEEMYKEFYEIANDLIPNILKEKGDETITYTKNPEFYADMLQFYDGICLWEEGSLTPVLHADWAKKLVQSINKFTPECRSTFSLHRKTHPESNSIVKVNEKVAVTQADNKPAVQTTQQNTKPTQESVQTAVKTNGQSPPQSNEQAGNKPVEEPSQQNQKPAQPSEQTTIQTNEQSAPQPNLQTDSKPVKEPSQQNQKPAQPSEQTTVQTNEQSAPQPNLQTDSKPVEEPSQQNQKPAQPSEQTTVQTNEQSAPQPNVQTDSKPQEEPSQPTDKSQTQSATQQNDKHTELVQQSDEPMEQEATQQNDKPIVETQTQQHDKPAEQVAVQQSDEPFKQEAAQPNNKPTAKAGTQQNDKPMKAPSESLAEKPDLKPVLLPPVLHSEKMKNLLNLITSGGKLNSSAIKLQLTAQSQVSIPKNRRRSSLKADVYLYDYDAQMKEEGAVDDDDDVFVARKRRKRKNDDRNWTAAQF